MELFRNRGGTVRLPPHSLERRRQWIAAAKEARESWDYLPVVQRTERLRSGLAFIWAAVRYPRCIVALLGGELVAALSFDIEPDHIEVHVAGSRQTDYARGAGTAIEFALAVEAVRRGLRVHSTYTADARNFHLRLGRRLDFVPGENSSEWSMEDCAFLVGGINEAL